MWLLFYYFKFNIPRVSNFTTSLNWQKWARPIFVLFTRNAVGPMLASSILYNQSRSIQGLILQFVNLLSHLLSVSSFGYRQGFPLQSSFQGFNWFPLHFFLILISQYCYHVVWLAILNAKLVLFIEVCVRDQSFPQLLLLTWHKFFGRCVFLHILSESVHVLVFGNFPFIENQILAYDVPALDWEGRQGRLGRSWIEYFLLVGVSL